MPISAIQEVLTSVAAHINLWEYTYTGKEQTFTAPYKGTYKIEAYGAKGSDYGEYSGGKGGYAQGQIFLNKGDILYVYVGGQNGYNGGGQGEISNGGGSTDIRIDGNEIENRIMVAAGGGGANKNSNGGEEYLSNDTLFTGTSNVTEGQNGSGGGSGYYRWKIGTRL